MDDYYDQIVTSERSYMREMDFAKATNEIVKRSIYRWGIDEKGGWIAVGVQDTYTSYAWLNQPDAPDVPTVMTN